MTQCIMVKTDFLEDFEMGIKEEILRLKKEKNAVILAHYYVLPEVQDLADFVGDSFALAKKAKSIDASIIVFAGVSFMGESAKILNPDKKVLMPDLEADCPMAHMATLAKVQKMREEIDDLAVVCYVNSTAELKKVSDVCVTSSNAVDIVRKLPQKNIYFIPDRHLASFVQKLVPEKNIILNEGYCPTHHAMTIQDVQTAKQAHPQALVFVHPECPEEVVKLADYAGSTAGIIQAVKQSDAKEFIIGTEEGVLHELRKQNPEKTFYLLSENLVCEDMKKVTLEKLAQVLRDESNEVHLDEKTMEEAYKAMDTMLEMAQS